jgi:EAL domain-containing protein (putative c-di-GMP-specific phosphodiesterase class I)
LLGEILEGLERDEFHLVYQPQMLADGSRVACVEALLRWNHPTRGPVGPADFVAEAERNGAIRQLGAFVLRRACQDAAAWDSVSIAVNVSGNQLTDPAFVDLVIAAASHAGLPLARLELELVENVLIENFELVHSVLARLRTLGVRIALDDFGAGYSSLTYLRKLPLDKLKIDKSFVDDLNSPVSAAIIQAIVAMAKALNLKTTAEGVETDAQRLFLRVAGCELLQGYLFSRPIPPAEMGELLARVQVERRTG